MRSMTPTLLALLCGAAGLVLTPARLAAEEDAPPEANPLQACEDDQAKKLAAEVKRIARKKNANDVLPVLEKLDGVAHEDFEKPLLKLLGHESSLVATRVAEMWEWRNNDKVDAKLWRAIYKDKDNDRRYVVKAKVLKSWPRAGLELDDKQFKEIERDWRWIIGNPDPAMAPALAAFAEYAALAKDKRMCRMLAEELDEPLATNVHAGNNPPASWWEKRWKMWKESKPAVVAALRALTGQEFDKTEEAKKWFEENAKTFGFDW